MRNLHISSYGYTAVIKFGLQVHPFERNLSITLSQVLVKSLLHYNLTLTNFWISYSLQIRILSGVFRLHLQQASSRQDFLTKTHLFALIKRLQKFFKVFSRLLQKNLQRHLQGIFSTSSRSIQNVHRFCKHLQDVFKTYHSRKIGLDNTSSTSDSNVIRTQNHLVHK